MRVVGEIKAIGLTGARARSRSATVGPVNVGTRSTSVTAEVVGGPGMEKLVPVTVIPVAPSLWGLATLVTVGWSRNV